MPSKKYSAAIEIGGVLKNSLKSAFTTTKTKLGEIGKEARRLTRDQRRLGQEIRRMRAAGEDVTAVERDYQALGEKITQARSQQDRLRNSIERMSKIRGVRDTARSNMFNRGASAFAVGASLAAPLKAFEDLDAATNNMAVAFMNNKGQLPSQFNKIKQETIELGNLLPGTTADFVNLASALREQGVSTQSIVGGALKAAADLSVVMKMPADEAGTMVAKLREAFHLSNKQFSQMADLTQRAKFAFGLNSEDMLTGARYYGSSLNALGLTGPQNAKLVYAIQGMANRSGMDGSTFGTNFGDMLTRMATLQSRMESGSKQMKEVNSLLQESGIRLQFFGQDGKFSGITNMVKQLQKLQVLSQKDRQNVLFRLFGQQAARVATLIAQKGTKGYEAALKQMDLQASLQQRINKATSSFKNTIEALTGTVTNFLAVIGEPIAHSLMPYIRQMNDWIGNTLQPFIEKHKEAVKVVGGLVGALAGLLAVGATISGLVWIRSTAIGGFLSLWGAVTKVAGVLKMLSTVVIPMVEAGWITLDGVFLASGIGAIIAALGYAAYEVYKHWKPIKAFFSNIWDHIKSAFKTGVGFIKKYLAWSPLGIVLNHWKPIADFFTGLWDKIVGVHHAATGNGQPLPKPSAAAARGHTTVHDNRQVTIHVHGDKDPHKTAQAIDHHLRVRASAMDNAAMYDHVMAY